MLEALFGNASIERVLFYLLQNKSCYALQLKKQFQAPLSTMQHALQRLEAGGILVSTLIGKTRVFQLNPRYPFLEKLCLFLQSAYEALPQEIRNTYYESPIRKRPRRTGKPLP